MVSPPSLSAAIVCYAADAATLATTVRTLVIAAERAMAAGRLAGMHIVLVDNGPDANARRTLEAVISAQDAVLPAACTIACIGDGRNVGFGAGHNKALRRTTDDFHLVLNPDVEFDTDALEAALAFMHQNPGCGLLSPAVRDGKGETQFLCRRLPGVFDLFLRGFAPAGLRRCFRARLDRYEMRDFSSDAVLWDPPIVSGCCMLFRTELLHQLGGFDEGFFLYFEDYDISLRAGRSSRLARVPGVCITHLGGHAARKGWRHVFLFVQSARRFFCRYGWRW